MVDSDKLMKSDEMLWASPTVFFDCLSRLGTIQEKVDLESSKEEMKELESYFREPLISEVLMKFKRTINKPTFYKS